MYGKNDLSAAKKNSYLKKICISTLHAGDYEQLFMFINYHVNIGAEHVYVFLDMPIEDCLSVVPQLENVTVTACDDDYWIDKFDHYPKSVEEKQRFVMIESSRLADKDGHEYLMMIDTDELVFSKKSIHLTLSKFAPEYRSFALPVAEARLTASSDIGNPFGASFFVLPDGNRESRELFSQIYGENDDLMTNGLYGHRAGKTIYRLPFRYRSFNLHGPSTKQPGTHARIEDDTVRLLHFDCGSLGTWKNKWAMRLSGATNAVGMSSARIRQRDRIRQALATDPAEQEACFKDFFALPPKAAKQLKAGKLAVEIKLDPALLKSPMSLSGQRGQQTFNQYRTIHNSDVYQIAFACDSNFIQPSCACMLSFMDKVETDRIVVAYVLCDGIDDKDTQQIRDIEDAIPNLTIIICDQTEKLNNDVGTQDLKRSTYSRLYLIDHVRSGRLVYIDSDMLVLRDISNLFSLDLGGNIIAGAVDSAALRTMFSPESVPEEQMERLLEITGGLDTVLDYLNAGLLVLDMDHPEYLERAQRCQELMRDKENPLKQRDQDAVNICFKGRKKKLDHSYNYMLQFFESKRAISPEIRQYRVAATDYRILHYSGKLKPWDARSDGDNFYVALYRTEVLRLEQKYGVSCNFEFSDDTSEQSTDQDVPRQDNAEQILSRMLSSGRKGTAKGLQKNAEKTLKRARSADQEPLPFDQITQLGSFSVSGAQGGSDNMNFMQRAAQGSPGIWVDGEVIYANDKEIVGEVEYWIAGVPQDDIAVKLVHHGRILGKTIAKASKAQDAAQNRASFRFEIPRQLIGKEYLELYIKIDQHDIPLSPDPFVYNGLRECTTYGLDGVCEKISDEDHVRGWVYDRRKLDQAIEVDMYFDGAFQQRVLASNHRTDLERSKVASGSHGFSIRLPRYDSQSGEHIVTVFVANSGIQLRRTPIRITPDGIELSENKPRRKKPLNIPFLKHLISR